MSDKSRAAWAAILEKRRKKVEPQVAVGNPVTKKVSTCGNPMCCGRQAQAYLTHDGPSIVGPGGLDMGGVTLPRGFEPPMPCGGTAWQPKVASQWQKKQQERRDGAALEEFKKK